MTQPFYSVSVDRIGLAKSEIRTAIVSSASPRGGHISNAVSRIENARDPIGADITFNLGQVRLKRNGHLFTGRIRNAEKAI
jgi:hypothetical protein